MSSLNQAMGDPIHFKPATWSFYLIWYAFVIYYEREQSGEEAIGGVKKFNFFPPCPHLNLYTPSIPPLLSKTSTAI